jgi:hypothetical protein
MGRIRRERGKGGSAQGETIGHQNGSQAQILSGLDAGDRIVVHPNELIRDGSRIRERMSE